MYVNIIMLVVTASLLNSQMGANLYPIKHLAWTGFISPTCNVVEIVSRHQSVSGKVYYIYSVQACIRMHSTRLQTSGGNVSQLTYTLSHWHNSISTQAKVLIPTGHY